METGDGNKPGSPDGRVASAQQLLAAAITLVKNGTLPHDGSIKVLAGPGQHRHCALCNRPIGSHEVEYEMTGVGADSTPRACCFHIPCYHAWKQACSAVAAED